MQVFNNRSSGCDGMLESWASTISFVLVLERCFFSQSRPSLVHLCQHRPTHPRASSKLPSIFMRNERRIGGPLDLPNLRIIVFPGNAQSYPVPLFTWICLSTFRIKLRCRHIGESRIWDDPLHVRKYSIFDESKVLTCPVSPIPKKNRHIHSILVENGFLRSQSVHRDSLT